MLPAFYHRRSGLIACCWFAAVFTPLSALFFVNQFEIQYTLQRNQLMPLKVNMTQTKQDSLFQTLLGTRVSLDVVLNQASQRIADIDHRKTFNSFHSVKKDGVSVTRLYDYKNLAPVSGEK